MPSNAKLVSSILAVSATLGLDSPDTSEASNSDLSDMLKELNNAVKVRDLRARVRSIAAQLDVDAPEFTDDDTPASLNEMLAGANAELERRNRETLEEQAGTDSAAAATLAKVEAADQRAAAPDDDLPEFYVAKGKALTTIRGILSDGDAITAKDLPGGDEALQGFIDSGHVAGADD